MNSLMLRYNAIDELEEQEVELEDPISGNVVHCVDLLGESPKVNPTNILVGRKTTHKCSILLLVYYNQGVIGGCNYKERVCIRFK